MPYLLVSVTFFLKFIITDRKMASPTSKLIDKIPSEVSRPRKMEVLALGLSRTGTMCRYFFHSSNSQKSFNMFGEALCAALNRLDYNCYHMSKVQYNQHKKHFWIWYEAMEAKFKDKGERYTPEDIDRVLEDYSASLSTFINPMVSDAISTY